MRLGATNTNNLNDGRGEPAGAGLGTGTLWVGTRLRAELGYRALGQRQTPPISHLELDVIYHSHFMNSTTRRYLFATLSASIQHIRLPEACHAICRLTIHQ